MPAVLRLLAGLGLLMAYACFPIAATYALGCYAAEVEPHRLFRFSGEKGPGPLAFVALVWFGLAVIAMGAFS